MALRYIICIHEATKKKQGINDNERGNREIEQTFQIYAHTMKKKWEKKNRQQTFNLNVFFYSEGKKI